MITPIHQVAAGALVLVTLLCSGCSTATGTVPVVPPIAATQPEFPPAPPQPGAQPGATFQKIVATDSTIGDIALSADGNTLVSGDWAGVVRVWDVQAGVQARTLTAHTDEVYTVAISPDGQLVASGGKDMTVHIDRINGLSVATLNHPDDVQAVAFSPDGTRLVTAGYDNAVKIWDTGTWTEVGSLTPPDGIYDIAWSPDGETLAMTMDGQVLLANADGTHVGAIPIADSSTSTMAVAFSPDGSLLAAGGNDKLVHVFRTDDLTTVHTLTGHKNYVQDVAFSPDGTKLASTGNQGTALIWDVGTGTQVQELPRMDASYAVAFTPDGNSLYATSSEQIWGWRLSFEG